MSTASDLVSNYRQALGRLLKDRETLRAYHKKLDAFGKDGSNNYLVLADPSAFQGTNSDLSAADVAAARAVLDGLDATLGSTSGAEAALAKVAGASGLVSPAQP